MTEENFDRDAIARRIRGLQAKTLENGATEAEAIAAADMVGRLMAKYRLTQTDVELQAEPIEERVVKRRQREKQVSEDSCVRGIMRYCGVKSWFSHRDGERKVIFYGWRADCDHAEWIYKMVGPTIMSAAEVFKRETRGQFWTMTERRQAVLDFRMGMAARINQRLHQMADELDPLAKTGSGTALVPMRNALVEDAYKNLGLRLTASKGRRVRRGDAYGRGVAEGDKVGLRRPVGSGPATRFLR